VEKIVLFFPSGNLSQWNDSPRDIFRQSQPLSSRCVIQSTEAKDTKREAHRLGAQHQI